MRARLSVLCALSLLTVTIFFGTISFGTISFGTAALADEGMWLLNNFPSAKVKEKYGFSPDAKWLENVQLSSARLAGGCSASFVSENGLVMTNHHCAHRCIEQLSTAQKDFVKSGFYAVNQGDEIKCPEIEVNQLVQITDVTERINKATAGLSDQKFNEAQKAEMSKIEKTCSANDAKVRCDVVDLYKGGQYHLYKYKRHQDVRLVFAPEFAIAFFGGDPDNFMFPRYDLDVSFLRVYENDKPLKAENFFRWSKAGVQENDLVFVSGHPGRTSRLQTIAELEYARDVQLPERLFRLAEIRGVFTEFQKRGEEQKRIANSDLFSVENSYKALRGRHGALVDRTFFAQKVAEEKKLRDAVNADPEKKKKYAAAWDNVAKAVETAKKHRKPYALIEGGSAFSADYFSFAKALVRGADERLKPNEKRFREYNDAALPALTQHLFSTAPLYDELEITTLTFSLTKLREELGSDHPFVKKVLGKQSPEDLATQLVKNTTLKDVAERKRLWEGGKKAVDASKDPFITLVKNIDADARTVRKKFEDEVEGPIKKNAELIAKARFEVLGSSIYPDATFTLRLSYGAVKGWDENGLKVSPITNYGGAFERATGREPFALPESWLKAKSKLALSTPFDFVSTNDIIGGNSGSPVINRSGEVVGLIFDGNIHSLGGEYGFDEWVNRAVSVHSEGLIRALSQIYGAERIVTELRPPNVKAAK